MTISYVYVQRARNKVNDYFNDSSDWAADFIFKIYQETDESQVVRIPTFERIKKRITCVTSASRFN